MRDLGICPLFLSRGRKRSGVRHDQIHRLQTGRPTRKGSRWEQSLHGQLKRREWEPGVNHFKAKGCSHKEAQRSRTQADVATPPPLPKRQVPRDKAIQSVLVLKHVLLPHPQLKGRVGGFV